MVFGALTKQEQAPQLAETRILSEKGLAWGRCDDVCDVNGRRSDTALFGDIGRKVVQKLIRYLLFLTGIIFLSAVDRISKCAYHTCHLFSGLHS